MVVGNGYTVPPAGRLLPPIRPWAKDILPQSRAHEALLLAAMNKTRAKISGTAIDFFADLFQGDSSFVCTLGEFDPYRTTRTGPLSWPFNIPKMPPAREFHQRKGAPIFCYLQRDHPALRQLLSVLSRAEGRSEIYVQGIDPHQVARYCFLEGPHSHLAGRSRDARSFFTFAPRRAGYCVCRARCRRVTDRPSRQFGTCDHREGPR